MRSDSQPEGPPELPPIPAKRYFTIGEVSELCMVKPHVLRYWEQEFSQLRPAKRRGNRRYYQHHEVLLIRRIRELLYDEGFTIMGARGRLNEEVSGKVVRVRRRGARTSPGAENAGTETEALLREVREELQAIADLLAGSEQRSDLR
ncbi:MAG: MerR family transcriptional regulator [Casimicrobiaceae bacterium]|nr:MerR family transcriptional regulator [Casimicrobiaceae bacterium]